MAYLFLQTASNECIMKLIVIPASIPTDTICQEQEHLSSERKSHQIINTTRF